jgi:hypothetical protein
LVRGIVKILLEFDSLVGIENIVFSDGTVAGEVKVEFRIVLQVIDELNINE